MAKVKTEPEARYCRECGRKMDRTAGGDLLWCCTMGTDSEAIMGDLVAFEATDGSKYAAPLPPMDVANLLPDTARLLDLLMQSFDGVAWERDILARWRGRLPSYAKALGSPLVFRREGYRVADNMPTQDFRVFVTDLAYDGWKAARLRQVIG